MNDVKVAILDAAEKRIRTAGFNGFSFREIADDVGVKSSSVHYHFRTKIDLAAAVIHRYTGRIAELFDRELKTESDIAKICTKAFRGTLHSAGHMCPSTVLGAGSLDLPEPVAAEVRAYFQMCLEKMMAHGLSEDRALQHLSTITGAMVLANAMGDLNVYDRATGSGKRR